MKLFRFLLIAVFVISLFGLSSSSVTAQTFTQYLSGVTIQNLSSNEATVTAHYYDQNGNVIGTTTDQVAAYGVVDYVTIPMDSGFQGSLMLSSDFPIGAVSTLRGENKGRGAYVSFEEGSNVINYPMLMKNWGSSQWNTWIVVQNIHAEDSAQVAVDYAACPGGPEKTATIPAGAMVEFKQANEACMSTMSKVMTSAVVTSTNGVPIVGVVNQESKLVNASLVSSGFPIGDIAPVIPLINSNNPNTHGWRTAISVFNRGNTDTVVEMTYVQAANGSTCTETHNIPAQQSVNFAGNNLIVGLSNPGENDELTCQVGARLVGSAYVSSNSENQELVATVNQDRGGLASAYGALSTANGSATVFLPQIQDRNGATNQWASSIMVMNVGDSPTYVKCEFANSNYKPTSGQLAPLKSWENFQRGNIAPGYVGSGFCTAYTDNSYNTVDSSAKIVAVVNIRGYGNNHDLMMSYEGLNQ